MKLFTDPPGRKLAKLHTDLVKKGHVLSYFLPLLLLLCPLSKDLQLFHLIPSLI